MNNKHEKLEFDLDFLGKDPIDASATSNENTSVINEQKENSACFINSKNSETNNEKLSEVSTKKVSNLYKHTEEKDDLGCVITACIALAFFVCFIGLFAWLDHQKNEIKQTTELAYSYKKEKNLLYEETVQKLAMLSNKDVETIKQELQTRFDNEKDELLKNIINEMVENNTADKEKIQQCTKIYFNNNKKECENKIKELFIAKKIEITKKLVDDWKNNAYNYEEDKAKYLKSLFNNDIKQLNKAMDKQLGYKEFTLVEQTLPESGVMHIYSQEEAIAPFKISTQQNFYSYDNYETSDNSEHYYIKMIDSYTNKTVVTLFVRSGDEIKVEVPLGSYKIKYATGKKWYGEKDLFGHDTIYSKSDEIIDFTASYNYVNGHSLTLYKVSNGNFSTQKINAKDF